MSNWDIAPPATYLHTHAESSNVGVYAQDEWSLSRKLTLNLAGRYDYYSSFGGTANPRVAVIYHPFASTTLKFVYGQAFRAANAYERDYTTPPPSAYLGNPNLSPEHMDSYELAWEQKLNRDWRWTAELFQENMRDLITQTTDAGGNFTFANSDAVRTRGVELEADGRLTGGLLARCSYTLSDVKETKPSLAPQTSANSPRHLAKAALSVPLYRDRFFASLEVQAMSNRRTVGGNEVPGFATANFTLFGRELVKNLEVSASIYNLLDHRYRDPVSRDFTQDSIEQDGRTFRVKLTYHF